MSVKKQRKTSLMAAATLLVSLALTSCETARDVAEEACLETGRTVVSAPAFRGDPGTWPPSAQLISNGSAVDARGSMFDGSTPYGERPWYGGIKFHSKTGSRAGLCMVGGTVYTTMDPELTPWATWHNAYAVTVEVPEFHAIGTRVLNHGDAFNLTAEASNWQLTGVAVDGASLLPHGYAHDDCVQNDGLNGGKIVDSKFDGCYVFLSHQHGSGTIDATGRTVEITDTLVYLRPYHSTYKPEQYGYDQTGPFFKTRGPSPKPQLVIRNSVFRADQPADFEGVTLPAGTDCDGVVLIGTEVWPADQLATWTSQCTNVQFGTAADWNTAVAAWNDAHPPFSAPTP